MKNKFINPAYDIDELVAAYPDQQFLNDSKERAWKRMQEKKRKKASIVLLRRVLSAAAILVLIAMSYVLLHKGSGRMVSNLRAGFPVVKIKIGPFSQPATVSNPDTTGEVKAVHSVANAKETGIKNSPIPMPVKPIPDSVFAHPQAPPGQLVSFKIPDSNKTKLPVTRKSKTIPPSTYELFDGMQKMANSKLKILNDTDTRKTIKTNPASSNPDTLFPKSFN